MLSFSDEPDPPGQPQICDWGPDFGEMTFTKPPSDGGAEITEYVIEMKDYIQLHNHFYLILFLFSRQ